MTLSNFAGNRTSFSEMASNSKQSSSTSLPLTIRESRASTGKIDFNVTTKKKRSSVLRFIASKSKFQTKKSKKQPEPATMSIEEEAAASRYNQKRRHSRLDANEPIEDVFAGIEFEKIKKKVSLTDKVDEENMDESIPGSSEDLLDQKDEDFN